MSWPVCVLCQGRGFPSCLRRDAGVSLVRPSPAVMRFHFRAAYSSSVESGAELTCLGSRHRTAYRGPDHSANTADYERRRDARRRMLVAVTFGPKGSSDAEADEGSDQGMAPISRLPRSSGAGGARIWDRWRNGSDGSSMGKLGRCQASL